MAAPSPEPTSTPLPGPDPDTQLMGRLAGGDMTALGELVQRHQQTVRLLAYRMTNRWDVADDLAQEAFLRIYRAAPRYQPTAQFTTWLYRIVANLCLDHARRRHPLSLPEDSSGLVDNSTARDPQALDALLAREQAAAVQAAVARLPQRQRLALVLHRFHDLDHRQISQITGWSRKATESLLVRAYQQLRRELALWNPP